MEGCLRRRLTWGPTGVHAAVAADGECYRLGHTRVVAALRDLLPEIADGAGWLIHVGGIAGGKGERLERAAHLAAGVLPKEGP